MRHFATVLPLLMTQCLSASTSATMSQIAPQSFAIASTPVALDSDDPARTRIGSLRFLGGWRLTSDMRWFGGLSSLDVDRGQVTALSDAGAIVRFRIGRFGHASDAEILPLPPGCGPSGDKADRDTESLAHDAARATWWVGYEVRNAVCRIDSGFRLGQAHAPAAMARWRATRGPETMVRLGDGRFIVIAEGRASPDSPDRELLIFDRDPTDRSAQVTHLLYHPPDGFSPTDAAELHDGRLLVLNRRFSLLGLFAARIALIDLSAIRSGQIVEGRTIATFAPPVLTDNYEGIAVTQDEERTVVWLLSDDNYMRWQRTLLLKFALED